VYVDAVVDFVEFDHLICASAVLNCSGSFMSLHSFAIRLNRWMLFSIVSSVLFSFLSSSAYLSRSGVLFTCRCVEFMLRGLTPACQELLHAESSSVQCTLQSSSSVSQCT